MHSPGTAPSVELGELLARARSEPTADREALVRQARACLAVWHDPEERKRIGAVLQREHETLVALADEVAGGRRLLFEALYAAPIFDRPRALEAAVDAVIPCTIADWLAVAHRSRASPEQRATALDVVASGHDGSEETAAAYALLRVTDRCVGLPPRVWELATNERVRALEQHPAVVAWRKFNVRALCDPYQDRLMDPWLGASTMHGRGPRQVLVDCIYGRHYMGVPPRMTRMPEVILVCAFGDLVVIDGLRYETDESKRVLEHTAMPHPWERVEPGRYWVVAP
jgi:hypothetical protein